jgi:hypothetical protein
MSRSFNYERAAMVLCDAVMMGDRAAAQKWDISLDYLQLARTSRK